MGPMTSAAIFYLALLIGGSAGFTNSANLSCYQCTKKNRERCPPETLLPCPTNKDRCVTHISQDSTNGFILKKECGLGPCGFEDDMVNRGLGLDKKCDTSKDEFFCIFCCRTNGCNGAAPSGRRLIDGTLTAFFAIFVVFTVRRL